jgi:hypothetical protein
MSRLSGPTNRPPRGELVGGRSSAAARAPHLFPVLARDVKAVSSL